MSNFRIRLSPYTSLWWIEKKTKFLWFEDWDIYSKCDSKEKAVELVKLYEDQQSKGSGE